MRLTGKPAEPSKSSGMVDSATIDRIIRILEAAPRRELRVPNTLQVVMMVGPMRCALWQRGVGK